MAFSGKWTFLKFDSNSNTCTLAAYAPSFQFWTSYDWSSCIKRYIKIFHLTCCTAQCQEARCVPKGRRVPSLRHILPGPTWTYDPAIHVPARCWSSKFDPSNSGQEKLKVMVKNRKFWWKIKSGIFFLR